MDRSDCLVHLNNTNTPITTSLTVAEAFGKRHDNVVRAIRDLTATAGEAPLNFEGSAYQGLDGAAAPCFLMDEEAFALLVMGFTGKEALSWKRKFIMAFKMMRDKMTNLALIPIEQAEYNLKQWKEAEAPRLDAEAKLTKVAALVPLLTPYYQAQKLIAKSVADMTITQTAKVLNLKPSVFGRYLDANKWVCRDHNSNRVPHQDKVNKGLIVLKYFDYEGTQEYYEVYKTGYRPQVMITSKGVEHLSHIFGVTNE